MLKGNRTGRSRSSSSEGHLRTETCWQCKGPGDTPFTEVAQASAGGGGTDSHLKAPFE